MNANQVEEEVVRPELTSKQLEEYSSRYEQIVVDLMLTTDTTARLGRMLIKRVDGVNACNQYLEFTNRLDLALFMLDVIDKTVEWGTLDSIEPLSEKTVEDTLIVISEILSCPGKSVRSLKSSVWEDFGTLSRRERVRYLFLEFMIKEVCGIPFRVKTEVEIKPGIDLRDLLSWLLGFQEVTADMPIEFSPGLDIILRVHTLIGLFAKLLKRSPYSRYTPLTRRFVVGYSTEILRILDNPLRSLEERYRRRVKELEEDGWVLGNTVDVDRKITPWITPFEEAPFAALQRDRVMWVIVLVIIGYDECL
jgi:hypothetical protein